MSSYGSQNTQQNLTRRASIKPLLNFDEGETKVTSLNAARVPATKSVFGVDTLWEREMVKLREIQAKEEVEEEERRKREEEAERKRQEKERKKRKKKGRASPDAEELGENLETITVAMEPPTLPVIERATRRPPPKPSDSDISSDSEDDGLAPTQLSKATPSWHVGSSDEEEAAPRRTTGVGPRYPKHAQKPSAPPADDDSEEDLPLAATIHKAVARATFSGATPYPQDSDDEDKPLSHILLANSNSSPVRHNTAKRRLYVGQESDEDDDQPLGLRASRIPTSRQGAEEEDDVPLAFHPEQQRRTQYQMLAQQQQQMMMQAQMQSAMMMNASMMSFYGPPMMNSVGMMPMQVPIPIPSPPPMADEASFGRVDRWRRDIVVDRDNL